jgi:hypothetical protein
LAALGGYDTTTDLWEWPDNDQQKVCLNLGEKFIDELMTGVNLHSVDISCSAFCGSAFVV